MRLTLLATITVVVAIVIAVVVVGRDQSVGTATPEVKSFDTTGGQQLKPRWGTQ